MTTPEEIEELLNMYGETLKDLPKSSDYSGTVYESKDLIRAKKNALAFTMDEWNDTDAVPEIRYEVEDVILDFVCHQSDVIEKLVYALRKASLCVESEKPRQRNI